MLNPGLIRAQSMQQFNPRPESAEKVIKTNVCHAIYNKFILFLVASRFLIIVWFFDV